MMKDHALPFPDGYDKDTQPMTAMFAVQLDDQLYKLKKSVEGLTVEQLEWQLKTGMNTIGMLLAHIAVAETFWTQVAPAGIPHKTEGDKVIKDIIGIGGEDDGLPLPESGKHPETLAGKTLEDYLSMLDKCRAATHNVLQTWKDEDLDTTFVIEDYSFSRSWTLYHILEHLSAHLGQVLLLKHIMVDNGLLTKNAQ
jgi:uncharacterized damage-inducible protein DinB